MPVNERERIYTPNAIVKISNWKMYARLINIIIMRLKVKEKEKSKQK